MTQDLKQFFKGHIESIVSELTALVNIESPTNAKDAVDQLTTHLEERVHALGADSVKRYPHETVGDMLLAKWHSEASGKPILFLTHIDTVLPLGTLKERPVHQDDDGRLYGPGILDMKGGIVVALAAIEGLTELDTLPERPIWFLATTDEEVGSGQSWDLIEETAKQCGLVLVMEPANADGAIKTWRKGAAVYRVIVTGRASHAGIEPEAGSNAAVELARQIIEINRWNDLRSGTSVSVTTLDGGTAMNVIPAQASAYVDVRFLTHAAMQRIDEQFSTLAPLSPGAGVNVERIHQRPPMEHNETMKAAVAQVQAIGAAHGITVREDGTGGGSDGNITASLGIPTLDGLGPQGIGQHATHEHVLINSLPERAALIAAILTDWPQID